MASRPARQGLALAATSADTKTLIPHAAHQPLIDPGLESTLHPTPPAPPAAPPPPPGAVCPARRGTVSLHVVGGGLLHDLLRASPSANLMVEVPNFMAADPANVEAIVRLHGNGNTLLLKGRPNAPLPREAEPALTFNVEQK